MLNIDVYDSYAGVESLFELWQELQDGQLHPVFDASPQRYLAVARAFPERQPYVIKFSSGTEHLLMIGWLVRQRHSPRLGYARIPTPVIKSFNLVYGGIIGSLSNQYLEQVDEYLRDILRQTVDSIGFDHIRVGGWVQYSLLGGFYGTRTVFSPVEKHWRMHLAKSRQDFLKSLSKRHRTKLKSYVKKLAAVSGDDFEVKLFDKPEQMDVIFRDVPAISRKTYQYGLGAGFEDTESRRLLISETLKQGQCKIFILYVKGQPVSFRYDIVYRDSVLSHEIGFDPEWASFSVGSVLFLESLEHLIAIEGVRIYDFGFGDADYKKRYGEFFCNEFSCDLYSYRPGPLGTAILVKFIGRLDKLLRNLLTRLGIEARVKRVWRDLKAAWSKQE